MDNPFGDHIKSAVFKPKVGRMVCRVVGSRHTDIKRYLCWGAAKATSGSLEINPS